MKNKIITYIWKIKFMLWFFMYMDDRVLEYNRYVFSNAWYWAKIALNENHDGKHKVLTPKQAAIEIIHWCRQ